MDFASYSCDVLDDEGFTEAKDIFKRKAFALGLTNILSNTSRSMSIMIDAPWGEGKTTFLRMWAGDLRKSKMPVIYLDAFETDYCADPFQALSAAVTEFIKTKCPKNAQLRDEFLKASALSLMAILKGASKLGAQALIHHSIGPDAASTLKEMEGEIAKSTEAGIEFFWKNEIAAFAEERARIQELKTALANVPTTLSDKEDTRPLIIMIDELDRCRPDYALAMLERVKHFLATPNVHLVLAVNYKQLTGSISSLYGNSIDAGEYFQKFFDFKFSLPTNIETPVATSTTSAYSSYLFEKNAEKFAFYETHRNDEDLIDVLAKRLRPSLRALEKIYDNLTLLFAQNLKQHSFITTLTITCIFFKHTRNDIYHRILNGVVSLEEIEDALDQKYVDDPPDQGGSHQIWYALICWARCLLNTIPAESHHTSTAAQGLHFSSVKSVPQVLANKHIERFQPTPTQ